ARQRVLRDGDMLRVFPISPKFDNAVMLRGNVDEPGRFRWHEGMRVSDLIPSREFLITRSYWYQENHLAESVPSLNDWSEQDGFAGASPNEREAGSQVSSSDRAQLQSRQGTQLQLTGGTQLESPERTQLQSTKRAPLDMMSD